MTPEKTYNVLFLCTGNSARSIMAECLMRRWSNGRFNAFSAGSMPRGVVDPMALDLLHRFNHPVDGLRSKDWNEFARPGSPALDFVFTVCDKAAGEPCPVWPGQPMTAHWGVEDPVEMVGTDEQRMRAFRRVYLELDNRIKIFASLRIDSLDRLTLKRRLDEIGRIHRTDADVA
ncbi:arsenate reductase ArsC [Azospirillum soli]|uniref:arsenate reductase ArsC n=1 Tax=Azospirillum soli TaxID=1304799 RepID=UPI001AE0F909|nr:arsenate reductase ArsC [Azospirillum soli]MBP2316520.1 protein-tyrosine-phosphatase [Azospirillum soli]